MGDGANGAGNITVRVICTKCISNNERQGTLWILNKRRKVQWVVRANSGGTRVNMTKERGDIGNTSLSNAYLTAALIFIVHFGVQRTLKSSRIQRDECNSRMNIFVNLFHQLSVS